MAIRAYHDQTKSVEVQTHACKAASVIMDSQTRITILWTLFHGRFDADETASLNQCFNKHPALAELDLIASSCEASLMTLNAHLLRGE